MNNYDVGIIGAGTAGVFAALKIAKEHKTMKTILIDLGRPPQKRRRQCEGYFGCLPNSDGKLYMNDSKNASDIITVKRSNVAKKWFDDYVSDIIDLKIIKDAGPRASAEKRIKKSGFSIIKNDYVQIYPKDIHILSKHTANILFNSKNITMSFDNEVLQIVKNKNSFTVISSDSKIECKRIIICAGRSGWRWTKKLYDTFGLIKNNNFANFGIRVEVNSNIMKDFNKSSCSLNKENLHIGPLSWNGTIIPEDHIDLAISAFRSNEGRWKPDTDRVSFNLIGKRFFDGNGFEQTLRIGQLTFVLSDDRISKEKLSTIMSKKSKISIIPEYDWLVDTLEGVNEIMPDIINKGYFHVPTILPLVPQIKINNNLATEVSGLFAAGESAGIHGILAAAITGLVAANSVSR